MADSTPRTVDAAAREVIGALTGDPVKILVTGGIGTGKSTALEAVRRTLREAGRTIVGRLPGLPEADPREGAAVVVDDAHLLGDDDLRALTALADEPERTMVIATQPRDHRPALRDLEAALERERPRITLAPLTSADISPAVFAATGGIPLLVDALAGPQGPSATTMTQTATFALIERLRRLDRDELETLLIASLSTDLGAADIAATLAVSVQHGGDLVDRVRGTGLLQPSHPAEFLRIVHRSTAHLVGTARHHELETALLRTQLESSTLSAHLALELAGHGVRDTGLATWLADHAASLPVDSADRARIHRAAVDAGAADLRAGLADALALGGDPAGAAVIADELLGSADAAQRAAGVRIAASVAADGGNYAHAAELFGWLGPYPDAAVAASGALVHAATGNLAQAVLTLQAAQAGPPTAAARSARSLAEGVLQTIDDPHHTAAVRMGQALAGGSTAAALLPDSTPALVTLAALHSGDAARARSVIGRAVREGSVHPATIFTARHRLLQGWVRMLDGQLAAATADADAVPALRDGRDAFWAAALRTAIARRGGDLGALQAHWSAGMDCLAEYSIDLFSLLPLGELWMAAARLRQQDRLTPALEQGFGVLEALGNPPVWAPLLHWAGVHAGIIANDPAVVAPHGQALTAMAEHSPFAAALAAGGRTWLRVLAGQVDPDEVVAAARGLAGFGLTSDATRLTGQAALQAPDPKVSGLMLQVARDLKMGGAEAFPDTETTDRPPRPVSTTLSDREREVAELLLLGLPYRDIGGQLFISAKTVEHHVARIRRRLGAESRSEMLSMLRAMLTAGETPAPPNPRA